MGATTTDMVVQEMKLGTTSQPQGSQGRAFLVFSVQTSQVGFKNVKGIFTCLLHLKIGRLPWQAFVLMKGHSNGTKHGSKRLWANHIEASKTNFGPLFKALMGGLMKLCQSSSPDTYNDAFDSIIYKVQTSTARGLISLNVYVKIGRGIWRSDLYLEPVNPPRSTKPCKNS